MKAFQQFRLGEPNLRLRSSCCTGTGDQITSPAGSRRLVDAAGSPQKELRLYDGFVHELLNEPEPDRDRVMG